MARIRILPHDLVNQIAAGEVVERPASVVKELVENALDAGAHDIAVDMSGSGCELIRVSDNGSGMAAEELETAVLRHATSKISCVDDLFFIRTLGFRGEALPSILSVSRSVVSTRQAGDAHGHTLVMEGGSVVRRAPRGMPPGTIVEVADLFFNTPARRKFLKTPATEQRNAIDVMSRYALAYPGTRFTLTIDGRSVLNLPGGSTLEDRASSVLGTRLSGRLIPFRAERTGIAVSGLLAPPEDARRNRTGIHTFVNRRSVRDPMLVAAVIEGYRGLLMRGRFPVAVLFVDIDPAEVDVNVHPSKAEVRFRHQGAVFGLLASAVREALAPGRPSEMGMTAKTAGYAHLPPAGSYDRSPWAMTGQAFSEPAACLTAREERSVSYGTHRPLRMQEGSLFDQGDRARADVFTYEGLSVIGAFHATYVLLQDHEALYILDQHAAHERILYERLRVTCGSKPRAGQTLLAPMVLELSPREYAAFEDAAEAMGRMGIECEPFGDTSIAVRSVPQPLADGDIREAVYGVIHELMELGPGASRAGDRVSDLIAAAACHASVRAGKPLTVQEAQRMLEDLVREGSPLTCPHGRPLFRKIPVQEVERWMGRRI